MLIPVLLAVVMALEVLILLLQWRILRRRTPRHVHLQIPE